MRIFALSLFMVVFSRGAHAVVPVMDANVFYFTDAFTYDSDNYSYRRLLWDFTLGLNLDKRGSWVLGWAYSASTFSDNPGTETSLTVTDMGPKVTWYLNKDRNWVLGLIYNLITKANYSSGSTVSELRGSSMKVEAGYMYSMWDTVSVGAKINWYKLSFNEEIVDTSLSQVTHARTIIYPSFSFTIRWE